MTMPPDAHRLIQEVLTDLGWPADAVAIAEKVRRLNIGLPLEDEFSVVCAWLGKCELLHKLDQQQVPLASQQKFQVPDILARFTTLAIKSPVLIEVKSKAQNTLSFTPEYLQRLKNYADLLNMPLLIAWKFHSMWMLFDVKHMKMAKKNFNIDMGTALRESLLGALVGDVAYKIGPGAGIHLRFRKDELMGTERAENGYTEEWKMTVDEVTFSDYMGNDLVDLDSEVQSLFTAWDMEKREEHTKSHLHVHFIAGSDGMQFAHTALVRLLNWESPNNDLPHWRSLLRKDQVTTNVSNFSAALDKALRQKIVSHIFHVQPNTWPDFLPPR